MMDSYEDNNEPLDSIQVGECLNHYSDHYHDHHDHHLQNSHF
jgi:hypothetical protein